VAKKSTEVQKRIKTGDRKSKAEAELYARIRDHLLAGRLARYLEVRDEEERLWLRDMHLLSSKPVMYVCNLHESDINEENDYVRIVRAIAAKEGAKVVAIRAAVEAEVAEFPPEERQGFLEGLGHQESGLRKVIREGYALLQLITFFTVGPKEVHARTIRRGTTALSAAGVVHSDFERGFIRAEVMKYEDLFLLKSEQAVRDHGLLHIEGKEYLVEDGDVVHFRFNV
jgi:ribosome-binding ATPase